MRISDWSSDVCSSDLHAFGHEPFLPAPYARLGFARRHHDRLGPPPERTDLVIICGNGAAKRERADPLIAWEQPPSEYRAGRDLQIVEVRQYEWKRSTERSEEHTSELQSLMRNSYAVFCLKKKKIPTKTMYTSANTTIQTKRTTLINIYLHH